MNKGTQEASRTNHCTTVSVSSMFHKILIDDGMESKGKIH